DVLRRSIGYVPQEAFLFSRSLRDNVLLADEGAGDDRLRAAAETAGLLEEVQSLPHGWNSVVGERGLTLSGGQRQRAALAAARAGPIRPTSCSTTCWPRSTPRRSGRSCARCARRRAGVRRF